MNGDEPGLCQVLSLFSLSAEDQLATSSLSLGLGFLTHHSASQDSLISFFVLFLYPRMYLSICLNNFTFREI